MEKATRERWPVSSILGGARLGRMRPWAGWKGGVTWLPPPSPPSVGVPNEVAGAAGPAVGPTGGGVSLGVSFLYLALKSQQHELCEPGVAPAVLPPAVAHPAVLLGGGEIPIQLAMSTPTSPACGAGRGAGRES